MHPILFEIGPIIISSFGFMMVTAFLLCNYLLKKDVEAAGYDPMMAEDITFRAAIGGIVGAKLYYLIENIPTGQAADNMNGLVDIIAGIFTFNSARFGGGIQNFGAGLVFLGGLMGGMLAVTLYIHKHKLKWLEVADLVAPFLALGQGIGRIGCFLVGDDYGTPSSLPWACSFPKGLPPTDTPVHPTQIYEMAAYFSVFIYLRYKKRNQNFTGELMFEYLFLVGFFRFIIEFIRNNPQYLMGLTGAQYISIFMMLVGMYQMWKIRQEEPSLPEEIG